ncbi:MAG: tetratricopeptide repeat protein [Proteobacteria bacterium]|nr:tetratricopeptide repeat protein [Pseudomonadota bacterium]
MQTVHATAEPDALAGRIAALLDAGRIGAARPMLAALRALAPDDPAAATLAARLAIREGRPQDALPELDARIAAAPADAALRKSRAELRLLLNDRLGAAGDAAEAVILDRHDPAAKAMLGVMLLELGRAQEAAACLREAVAGAPGNPAYRQGLAAAQEAAGDADGAAATLAAAIAAAPGAAGLRTSAMLLAIRGRRFADAAGMAEAARRAGAADACVLGLLGHALSSLGRHEEASEAYAEALKLGPEDPYVRHLVSASGAVSAAGRAPLAYLRAVFDGCADTFEATLIGLGYRIPGLIRAALLRHAPPDGEPVGPVLDLGCGTGLAAVALSDLPYGPITGVDASPRMLAMAAAKGLYAELAEADVIDTLRADTAAWRIVLAADVLCYFGALEAVFAAVAARLLPGGLFVCSVEEAPDEAGWSLGRLGRYAHGRRYVTGTAEAAGLVVREIRAETLRHEADAPVPGLILVLQRPAMASLDVH